MKKIIFFILLFVISLGLIGCDIDINGGASNSEVLSIEIDRETMKDKYQLDNFNLQSIYLRVIKNNGVEEMKLNESMISLNDLAKLKRAGIHEINVKYQDKECRFTIKMVKKIYVNFYVDDEIYKTYELYQEDDLKNIPSVPMKDNQIGYWDETNFKCIMEDLNVHAVYVIDDNKILQNVVKEIDELLDLEIINQDIELPTQVGEVNISYESDSDYFTDDGKFKLPYKEETVNLNVTFSFNEKSINKIYTFKTSHYKDLNSGIAAGYLYRNYGLLTDEFFDTMDIIYCSFIEVDVDGDFVGTDGNGNQILNANKNTMAKIDYYVKPMAKEKGIYIVPSLGGGGSAASNSYKKICVDATLRKKFAENIVKLINENGYDGIDIDWETPGTTYSTYFTLMMEEIYNAVKANNPNHLITAAIGGGKWQPPYYDLRNSAKYLDYINVMCYGMTSNTGYYQNALYPHTSFNDPVNKVGKTLSSCSISESLTIYNNLGVNGSKLIFGTAFYGIKQTNNNGSWVSGGSVFFDSILNLIASGNYDYYFDETSKVPYLLSKDKKTFISYDDERSIIEKCHYVLNNNLAGIMFWENGCDTSNTLIHAINIGFNKSPEYLE